MNKKILCFILFIFIIAITILGCISNANNNSNKTSKQETEIGYIETKLSTLFNSLNNISFENYNITISQTNEEESSSQSNEKQLDKKGEQENSNQQNSDNSNQQEKNNSSESSEEQKNTDNKENQENTSNSQGNSDNEKYSFERIGILTKENNVDWNNIKNETELIYSIVPTVTLDLYQKNVNQNEILSFNKQLDNLTKSVSDEDKENTLKTLANLYSYLPKYSKVVSNEKDTVLLETKSNIFYAYSILETEDWNLINQYIEKAIESYSRILNITENTENINSINKCYILLNELKSSIENKNKDIFLIKYKNLMEEINIL